MPIYEYLCCTCGNRIDIIHKSAEKRSPACDKCDEIMQKTFSVPSLNFDGADWKNDWKKKNKKG